MNFLKPLTLQALGQITESVLIGPPDMLLTGINEVHCARPGDISFVDVEKYYAFALQSPASALIINREVEPPPGKGLLVSTDPFRDFNKLTAFASQEGGLSVAAPPKLGSGARLGQHVTCGQSVEIGPDTEIGHGVTIGSNVRIGARCRIFPNVFIANHSVIGNEVVIHASTVIGGDAFYYKRRPDRLEQMPSYGRVVIADRVHIGAGVTIDRGVTADTVIGEDTKIDNQCQIGHEVQIGRRCVLAAQVGIAGLVVIGDDVKLWGQAGVVQKVRIANGAQVLGQSGIMHDLEPGKTYFGSPASEHRLQWRMLAALRKLPDWLSRS